MRFDPVGFLVSMSATIFVLRIWLRRQIRKRHPQTTEKLYKPNDKLG